MKRCYEMFAISHSLILFFSLLSLLGIIITTLAKVLIENLYSYGNMADYMI